MPSWILFSFGNSTGICTLVCSFMHYTWSRPFAVQLYWQLCGCLSHSRVKYWGNFWTSNLKLHSFTICPGSVFPLIPNSEGDKKYKKDTIYWLLKSYNRKISIKMERLHLGRWLTWQHEALQRKESGTAQFYCKTWLCLLWHLPCFAISTVFYMSWN